mmetsp:Transcript_38345/g.85376  ORF Transcript_38345/g.85376 Transcript_38345/m.85376 type:complete len:348 (+) Transcript_38345:123-1166(+)
MEWTKILLAEVFATCLITCLYILSSPRCTNATRFVRDLRQTPYGSVGINNGTKESDAIPWEASNASSKQQSLKSCVNANQPNKTATSWPGTLKDEPSRFTVVGLWWSSKAQTREDHSSSQPGPGTGPSASRWSPLTLVTHLTFDRKWQLKALCKSWKGPLSAVIHLSTVHRQNVITSSFGLPALDADTPISQQQGGGAKVSQGGNFNPQALDAFMTSQSQGEPQLQWNRLRRHLLKALQQHPANSMQRNESAAAAMGSAAGGGSSGSSGSSESGERSDVLTFDALERLSYAPYAGQALATCAGLPAAEVHAGRSRAMQAMDLGLRLEEAAGYLEELRGRLVVWAALQ